MGHHVCLYQTIADGGTHGGTDLCTAIYHCVCDAAGLFPAKEIVLIIGTVLILVGMYLSNKSRKGASEKEK